MIAPEDEVPPQTRLPSSLISTARAPPTWWTSGAKAETHRVAVASGRIAMRPATFRMVADGGAKKGDVLGVARIAAVQAAKRTAELIPLAHPIALTRVAVDFASR